MAAFRLLTYIAVFQMCASARTPLLSLPYVDAADANRPVISKAIAENDLTILVTLGMAYLQGNGVPQNGKLAINLLIRGAICHESLAELGMGYAYLNGIEVPQNREKAWAWLDASVKDGNPRAQFLVGSILVSNTSNESRKVGVSLIKTAAQNGYAPAQEKLGEFFESGFAGNRDVVEALTWLRLATTGGSSNVANLIGKLESELNSAQKARVREEVKLFKATAPRPINVDSNLPGICQLGDFYSIKAVFMGKQTHFFVDTGASITCLNFSDVNSPSDFNVLYALNSASYTNLPITVRDCPPILIGQRSFEPLFAFTNDLGAVIESANVQAAGILGMNCLRTYVVKFDPDHRLFSIGGIVPTKTKSLALAIPLSETSAGVYSFKASINEREISLELDTGQECGLAITSADFEMLGIPITNWYSESIAAVGGGETNAAKYSRINKLKIGNYTYSNMIFMIDNTTNLNSRVGQEFLSRHVVTADFPDRVLYLQPGSHFTEPDELDMSGMSVSAGSNGISVYSVMDRSPAAMAGIEEGDIILEMDGRDTSAFDVNDVRVTLKRSPGRLIKMKVRRKNEIRFVVFQLKRLI